MNPVAQNQVTEEGTSKAQDQPRRCLRPETGCKPLISWDLVEPEGSRGTSHQDSVL